MAIDDAAGRAERAAHRSERFADLLKHPLLKEALTALQDESIATWRSTGPAEASAREEAYADLRAVDRVWRYLNAQATDGEVVAHNARSSLRRLGK